MKNPLMQDMKTRKIPVSSHGTKKEKERVEPEPVDEILVTQSADVKDFFRTRKSRSMRPVSGRSSFYTRIFWVLLIGVVLIGAYWCASYFEQAKILVTTKQQLFDLDKEKFTAAKSIPNHVNFEIMIINDTSSRSMILTESETSSSKATGTVILYNAYSTVAQKISAGSSIIDSKGLIYKTDKQITIPGYTLSKGKTVPGSATITVTASAIGDAYNGAPRDFNIVAFKGTSKYEKIYGRSKTPLSGGSDGIVYLPSAEERGELEAYALSGFKSTLLKKVNAQVPQGYILYPGAIDFSYNIPEHIQSKSPEVKVEISGTAHALLLEEKSLTSLLRKRLLPEYPVSYLPRVTLSGLDSLVFNFIHEDQAIHKDSTAIPFTLSGDIQGYWNPDFESLKNSMRGVAKNSAYLIFKQDPGIDTATLSIWPPWQSTVPHEPTKIRMIVK